MQGKVKIYENELKSKHTITIAFVCGVYNMLLNYKKKKKLLKKKSCSFLDKAIETIIMKNETTEQKMISHAELLNHRYSHIKWGLIISRCGRRSRMGSI